MINSIYVLCAEIFSELRRSVTLRGMSAKREGGGEAKKEEEESKGENLGQ